MNFLSARSGSERGMTGSRFGIRVSIAGVLEMCALLEQIPEATFSEAVEVLVGEVAAKVIDRNLQHEPGGREGMSGKLVRTVVV